MDRRSHRFSVGQEYQLVLAGGDRYDIRITDDGAMYGGVIHFATERTDP